MLEVALVQSINAGLLVSGNDVVRDIPSLRIICIAQRKECPRHARLTELEGNPLDLLVINANQNVSVIDSKLVSFGL